MSSFQHKLRSSEMVFRMISRLRFIVFLKLLLKIGEPGLDVYIILKGEVQLLVYNDVLVGEGIEISSPEEKEFLKQNYPLQTVIQ